MKLKINKKYLGGFLFLFSLYQTVHGQQMSSWSSYYENGFVWNPALTGRWNTWEWSVTGRKDWVGFEGAPESGTAAFQYPIIRRETKHAFGGYLEYDKIGPINSVGIAGTYAYKISPQLFGNDDDVLTFGIKAGAYQYRFNQNNLKPFDGLELDPALLPQNSSFLPDIAGGVYYVSVSDFFSFKSHYYAGLSFNRFLPLDINSFLQQTIRQTMHINAHLGKRFFMHRKPYYLEPNVFVNYAMTKAVNVMANCRFEMDRKFWLSAGAVSNGEVFGQVGVILGRNSFIGAMTRDGLLRLGVKADYNLGKFSRYGGVGYEVYFGYSFSEEDF